MTGINKRKADPIIASSIDIQYEIQPVPFSAISTLQAGESSAVIRGRVIAARHLQEERYKPYPHIHCNAQMTERMLHEHAQPNAASLDMLRMAMEKLKLSAPAYGRITLPAGEGCGCCTDISPDGIMVSVFFSPSSVCPP